MIEKAALPVLPTHPERPRLAALLNPGSLLATTALLVAVEPKLPPFRGE